ncbi:hypothetical protein [Candidatus Clostridium stratigraminis]|uniref:SipL SPOCS domain-containing protein n=1 Tax=Candidatus Clostridium stratigraminis TaxID=3381661 RepID=A0ABW8T682_9CLOT
MESLIKNKDDSFTVPRCTSNNKFLKPRVRHCCDVLIDFRTCLTPPPEDFKDLKVMSKLYVKIEKVCCGKVLIGGTLHKTIKWDKAEDAIFCSEDKLIVHKDIPFSCFIDFDCAEETDIFEIVGSEIICEFSELLRFKEGPNGKAIFNEKDIVIIAIQRKNGKQPFNK